MAHWGFDLENAQDDSGNARHGVPRDNVTFANDAAIFASWTYAQTAGIEVPNIDTQTLTFTACVDLAGGTVSTDPPLLISDAYGGWAVGYRYNGSPFIYFGKAGHGGEAVTNAVVSTVAASANVMQHVAVTYDGCKARFYLDGQPAGELDYVQTFDATPGNPPSMTDGYRIGARYQTMLTHPVGDFNGSIYDMEVRDYVMTPSDIALQATGCGLQQNSSQSSTGSSASSGSSNSSVRSSNSSNSSSVSSGGPPPSCDLWYWNTDELDSATGSYGTEGTLARISFDPANYLEVVDEQTIAMAAGARPTLAASPGGDLYTIEGNGLSYSLVKLTGGKQVIGPLAYPQWQGLHVADGLMEFGGNGTLYFFDTVYRMLSTIDPATAEMTRLHTYSFSDPYVLPVDMLQDRPGRLLLLTANYDIYALDLQTYAITEIWTGGNNMGLPGATGLAQSSGGLWASWLAQGPPNYSQVFSGNLSGGFSYIGGANGTLSGDGDLASCPSGGGNGSSSGGSSASSGSSTSTDRWWCCLGANRCELRGTGQTDCPDQFYHGPSETDCMARCAVRSWSSGGSTDSNGSNGSDGSNSSNRSSASSNGSSGSSGSSVRSGSSQSSSLPYDPYACGNGRVDAGEQCDDGNRVSDDACSNACMRARCGDGVRQTGESCDDGVYNSDVVGASCRTNCAFPRCGDGFRDEGEACDGGGDCTETCLLAFAAECTADSDCVSGVCSGGVCVENDVCGNGVLDPGEACDSAQDCTESCLLALAAPCAVSVDCDSGLCTSGVCIEKAVCGDGVLQRGEACDQGPANSNVVANRCRLNCLLASVGDGVIDNGEECDDGNITDGDGCTAEGRSERVAGGVTVAQGQQGQQAQQGLNGGFAGGPFGLQNTLPAALLSPPLAASFVGGVIDQGHSGAPTNPETGPAAVLLMASGAASGLAWVRRKRR